MVILYSNGFCLTCLQIANSPGQDKTRKWYQNGNCVSQCSGNYSIYSKFKIKKKIKK